MEKFVARSKLSLRPVWPPKLARWRHCELGACKRHRCCARPKNCDFAGYEERKENLAELRERVDALLLEFPAAGR